MTEKPDQKQLEENVQKARAQAFLAIRNLEVATQAKNRAIDAVIAAEQSLEKHEKHTA